MAVNCQQPTRPLRIRNAAHNVDYLMHPYLGGPYLLGELLTFVQETGETVLRIGRCASVADGQRRPRDAAVVALAAATTRDR